MRVHLLGGVSLQGCGGSKFWIRMMVGPWCWGSYVKDSVVIAPFDTGLYVNTCPLANVQEDSDNHISLLRVEQVTGWKTVTILGVDIRRKWKLRLSNWNFRMQDKIFDMFSLFTICNLLSCTKILLFVKSQNIVWFTKQKFPTNREFEALSLIFVRVWALFHNSFKVPLRKKYTPEV